MFIAMGRALILVTAMWSIAEHVHINSDEGIILSAILILFMERLLSIVQDVTQRKNEFVGAFGRQE